MTQLKEATLSHAVEAGGGGALKPRIMFPSQQDQLRTAESINRSQIAARGNIVEAYFMRNLLAPKDADKTLLHDLVRWKKEYVRMATDGAFDETFAHVYEEADLYAELMLRKHTMEKTGEPQLLS
jgi:hypothetical protein